MDKVKLDRNAVKAIEMAKSSLGVNETVDEHCLLQKNREQWGGIYDSLNDVSMSELARAVYIGYEVEPEFKEGDWVVDGVLVGKLVCVKGTLRVDFLEYGTPQIIPLSHLRHATELEESSEKERRFWNRNGRDVWELREGDLLHKDKVSFTVYRVYHDSVSFTETKFLEYWDGLKKNFKVACFAENRLDVSSDE